MNWDEDFVVRDDYSNKLRFENKKLYLELSTESRERNIGEIKSSSTLIYLKKKIKESVHLMRKNDSWGLHWDVIDNLPEDAQVVIHSDKEKYQISVKKIKEVGEFLWFKTQGFERQIFVKRSFWEIV